MIDFTQCTIEPTKFYDGLNGNKLAIYYENELYMLKFPKESHKEDSYASSTINEHIASNIFKILGFNAQDTLLGTYKEDVVVACKDFEGFDKRLINFGKVKNSPLNHSTKGFLDTDFNDTLKIINSQNIIDSNVLKNFYLEMFIADTFIANFDRHNGNWGLLADNNRNISIAPIYDCGSSLYPKLNDEEIVHYMGHKGSFNDLMLNQTTSAITLNGKKINPQMFLKNNQDLEVFKALKKVHNNIDMIKISNLIDSIEIISTLRKDFYKNVLQERGKILEKIIKNATIDNIQTFSPNQSLNDRMQILESNQQSIQKMQNSKDLMQENTKNLTQNSNIIENSIESKIRRHK
ncbi:HipA domain-containing protein [Helicobacter ganmani]|uniref:HipA domain-containing protein n=1 Tax=Helicobacter ganmani TaxID=60246 RepID=UPI003A885AC5